MQMEQRTSLCPAGPSEAPHHATINEHKLCTVKPRLSDLNRNNIYTQPGSQKYYETKSMYIIFSCQKERRT